MASSAIHKHIDSVPSEERSANSQRSPCFTVSNIRESKLIRLEPESHCVVNVYYVNRSARVDKASSWHFESNDVVGEMKMRVNRPIEA